MKGKLVSRNMIQIEDISATGNIKKLEKLKDLHKVWTDVLDKRNYIGLNDI